MFDVEMERWVGKVAVVTGASGGVGASLVEKLVKAGLKVVGFARRAELIEEHAKKLAGCRGKLYARKVDMSVEKDIIDGFKWTTEHVGPVHILVNNAGIMPNTGLAEGDTPLWRKVLDVNVLGLTIATREALKIMKANHIDGHIVFINSIAGHKSLYVPGGGLYSASKFAVTSYHDCLRQELNMLKSKIKLSSISPGVIKTDFYDNAQENTKGMIDSIPCLVGSEVADAIMYVLSTPPNVQIHELTIKPVGETM